MGRLINIPPPCTLLSKHGVWGQDFIRNEIQMWIYIVGMQSHTGWRELDGYSGIHFLWHIIVVYDWMAMRWLDVCMCVCLCFCVCLCRVCLCAYVSVFCMCGVFGFIGLNFQYANHQIDLEKIKLYVVSRERSADSHTVATRFKYSSCNMTTQIAKFMGPTWGPPGSCRPQVGSM